MCRCTGLLQFVALLHKGLLLRKRHYVKTFFEIAIPIALVCVPILLKSYAEVSSKCRITKSKWCNYTNYQPFDPFSKEWIDYDLKLVYAPQTPITDQFMKDTEMYLRNAGHSGKIVLKGTSNEIELLNYCLHQQQPDYAELIIVGTIFKNFENKLPASLDYKIRYGGEFFGLNFYTYMKYRMNGPKRDAAYLTTFFQVWQTTLEETFIQRKKLEFNKTDLSHKVWMQRFPYPEHKDIPNCVISTDIITMLFGLGYLLFLINIIRSTIEEKMNGSKELLKMMGMTNSSYWASCFFHSFITALVPLLIIIIAYKHEAILKYSDCVLVFLLLALYMASAILFVLAISIFFNCVVFGVFSFLIVYILSSMYLTAEIFLRNSDIAYVPSSLWYKLGILLLPPGALSTLTFFISVYEISEEGLQWNNLTEFSVAPDLSILMIIGALIFSCLLFIVGILYFDAVWPWQPGVTKPMYLFSLPSFCRTRPSLDQEQSPLLPQSSNEDLFEESYKNDKAIVVMQNLHKKFGHKLAVNNVSLDIYEKQITVFLGRNGAGKTAIMNLLTGLSMPTSGTASINSFDILTSTSKARRGLGVCPQHSVLFKSLTVEEHLKLYATMKGVQWRNIDIKVTEVLSILKLSEKRNELIKNLSAGMKRKLSLGIAIVGGPEVLFLEEPTLGMDVESKQTIWDELLKMKGTCTILLTSHDYEEANILGDRIVIMAKGEVKCSGSPVFLKQKFGTRKHLHIRKSTTFNKENVKGVLRSFFPEVEIGKEYEEGITFSLPLRPDSEFVDMLADLGNQEQSLGVISYELIESATLKDVLFSVGDPENESAVKHEESTGSYITTENESGNSSNTRHQCKLHHQFLALVRKHIHYSKRCWSFEIARLTITFLLTCLCLYLATDAETNYPNVNGSLRLDISSIYGNTDGFIYNKDPQLSQIEESLRNVLESNKVSVRVVDNPTHYILDYSKKDMSKFFKNLMVGGAINQDMNGTLNLTAWYNGEPYHAAPLSVLLMRTALLRYITGNSGSITMTHELLPKYVRIFTNEPMKIVPRFIAIVFISLALGFMSATYVLVPLRERTSKAKLLQLTTELPAVIYWIAAFIWDYLVWIVASILLIMPFAIFSYYAFFGIHSNAIGSALVLILAYGWASITFSYVTSFLFERGSAAFSAVLICHIFVGIGFTSVMKIIEVSWYDVPGIEQIKKVKWLLRIFPIYSFAQGISNVFGLAFNNAFCERLPQNQLALHCNISVTQHYKLSSQCCKNICESQNNCLIPKDIITWDVTGIGHELSSLLINGCINFSILLLLETGLLSAFFQVANSCVMSLRKSMNCLIIEENIIQDSDVLVEEERVRSLTATHLGTGGEALVVSGLTKVYRNFYAVNRLTFGIHSEECFGLLGVNGGGKSTIFRMLSGDIFPTDGNANIASFSLRRNFKKFCSRVGYCHNALVDHLTGREMLILLARLRGLTGSHLHEQVNSLIQATDLTAYADNQIQLYSGGNKKKLSVALSVIGSPPLILLDEPTAGLDPVSRQKIWNLLCQVRSKRSAVILTTHSMEEIEALCNRLAFMVNDHFCCLGSIQDLKSKHGQSYSVTIKMRRDQVNQETMDTIKSYLQNNLAVADSKEYQDIIRCYVVGVTLHDLKCCMSEMKNLHSDSLLDILITDSSLEQKHLQTSRAETPTSSRAETPTSSRAETPTASRAETPTASRAETPTASRAETPTASRAETPTASRAETSTVLDAQYVCHKEC